MAARAAAFAANRTKGLAWDGATLTLSRILFWFADDWGGPQAAARCAVEAMRSASPDLAAAASALLPESWRRRARETLTSEAGIAAVGTAAVAGLALMAAAQQSRAEERSDL